MSSSLMDYLWSSELFSASFALRFFAVEIKYEVDVGVPNFSESMLLRSYIVSW